MSWQPGDVSPDARRAAEAAAEAAGVPLKEWFAETVRAAIIRELGSLPTGEPALPLDSPESPAAGEPPAKPFATLSTATPERAPALVEEPPIPEPFAAAEFSAPPPITEAAPLAPEPTLAEEAFAPPEIAERAPSSPEPVAAPAAPEPPPIIEPAPTVASKDPRTVDFRRPPLSFGVQRLGDGSLSSWLATRIQGLPTMAGAPPRSAVDIPVPNPPAAVPPTATAPPASAPLTQAPGAPPPETVLPLSLPAGPVTTLPVANLRPARVRARHPSDIDAAIEMLAASVASQGVREPILVRRLAEGADQYEVVAGERRRLAAERAGRATLPAVIVEADDAEALKLSLTENLGRGDFSPLDEARAYLRLLTEYRSGPSALAQRLARDRSHIALAMRLLGLPPKVRQLIDDGRLAPAQAYALLSVPDPEAMAEQMIDAGAAGSARGSA